MDIQKAMLDPTSIFCSPNEVLGEAALTLQEKKEILRRWEYDARELQVAEAENMGGGPPDMLDAVLTALHTLDAPIDLKHPVPTKQD
ncbi:MAG: hypothetical protein AAFY78_21330 [Cyanobacteria bacterium J06648_16]